MGEAMDSARAHQNVHDRVAVQVSSFYRHDLCPLTEQGLAGALHLLRRPDLLCGEDLRFV